MKLARKRNVFRVLKTIRIISLLGKVFELSRFGSRFLASLYIEAEYFVDDTLSASNRLELHQEISA